MNLLLRAYKDLVLEKNNYQCKNCLNKATYVKGKKYDINNSITLCRECFLQSKKLSLRKLNINPRALGTNPRNLKKIKDSTCN